MSDLKAFIDQLNVILSWELAGTIQYLHHKAMVVGADREVFAEFFHEGSEEGREHAEAVADKIVVLGGVPTVEPATIRQASTTQGMLEATLELEKAALAAYEVAHPMAIAANMGTQFWIEEMIAHEQEHVAHVTMLLRKAEAAADAGDADTQAG